MTTRSPVKIVVINMTCFLYLKTALFMLPTVKVITIILRITPGTDKNLTVTWLIPNHAYTNALLHQSYHFPRLIYGWPHSIEMVRNSTWKRDWVQHVLTWIFHSSDNYGGVVWGLLIRPLCRITSLFKGILCFDFSGGCTGTLLYIDTNNPP